MDNRSTYAAFAGESIIAEGPVENLLPPLKERFDRNPGEVVLIFDDHTGRQVDFDLRGTLDEVLARVAPAQSRPGPGRPKLGVVSREVSLLPRHWEWLEDQPNGASAAIRRLVDQARKYDTGALRARMALGRFLSAMAGDLPGCEEAGRALYASDRARFETQIREWPADIRAYLEQRAEEAFREEALPSS